jgi:hypothetical protein
MYRRGARSMGPELLETMADISKALHNRTRSMSVHRLAAEFWSEGSDE